MRIDLTLSPTKFAAIQEKLGLTDEELGRKLYRIPDGPALVYGFRTGSRPVSASVAAAMVGFEGDFDRMTIAA